MSTQIPPSLARFGDELARAAHRELSGDRPRVRAGLQRRPRVLAGGTLGLVGVGAALVIALSGSSTPAAWAVTNTSDGVLVNLDYVSGQNLAQINAKLARMGTGEQVEIQMAAGAAAVSGPVTCTQAPGVPGPPVKVLVGSNGTEVLSAGQSAGNTAEGTFHLNSCRLYGSETGSGNSGNTGS